MSFTRPKFNNLDTSTFEIDDPLTELNSALLNTNPIQSDIGFILNQGSSGDSLAIVWDRSSQEFVFGLTTSDASTVGDINFTGYINLRANTITSNSIISSGIQFPTTDGIANQVLVTDGAGVLSFQDVPPAPAAWGNITGTLSTQTDLQTELNTKLTSVSPVDGGTF